MSQAGGPSGGRDQIAAANVAVTADLAGLEAKLKEAEAKVNASAQKMGAAAKVNVGGGGAGGTGSSLFPGVNLPAAGGGGAGGGAAQVTATAAAMSSVAAEAVKVNQAVEGINESLRKQTEGVRGIRQVFGLVTGAAGALLSVINTIQVAWDYFVSTFGDGAKKAEEFYASIGGAAVGGKAAEENLKKLQEQLQKVNAQLAWAEEHTFKNRRGVTQESGIGPSIATLKQEEERLKRLIKINADQVQRANENAKNGPLSQNEKDDRQLDKDIEAAKEQIKVLDFLLEEKKRRIDRAFEYEDRKQQQHIDRMESLGEAARSAVDEGDKVGAVDRKIMERQRQIAAAFSAASDPIEKQFVAMFGSAIIKGLEKEKANIQSALENMVAAAFFSALQASGGTGSNAFLNMQTSLSNILTELKAVGMSIPRDVAVGGG